jgi:hypothetical protein
VHFVRVLRTLIYEKCTEWRALKHFIPSVKFHMYYICAETLTLCQEEGEAEGGEEEEEGGGGEEEGGGGEGVEKGEEGEEEEGE